MQELLALQVDDYTVGHGILPNICYCVYKGIQSDFVLMRLLFTVHTHTCLY